MKIHHSIRKAVRTSLLCLIVTGTALASHTARAGAFAVDSRNGWYTYAHAEARDGDPAHQYNLAVNRAINYGAHSQFIRCSQFNVPRGTLVKTAVGFVPGKGWCGNWALNGANPADGLLREGATPSTIFPAFTWTE